MEPSHPVSQAVATLPTPEAPPPGVEEQLRAACQALFEEHRATVVLGYRKGSLPLRARPTFARRPEEVLDFIFDATCGNSLAIYLERLQARRREVVGVVTKGCDARAIHQLVASGRVDGARVVRVGVPCPGMVDAGRLGWILGCRVPVDVALGEDDALVTTLDGGTIVIDREALLCRSCITCASAGADPSAAVRVAGRGRTPALPLGAVSAAPARWEAFQRATARCIRCGACARACPVLASTRTEALVADTPGAYHQERLRLAAAHCVDCGACARACPTGTDLRPRSWRTLDDPPLVSPWPAPRPAGR